MILVTMVTGSQETDHFSSSGKMDSIPIEERQLKRSRASEFYSYEGLTRNVVSEWLLYITVIKELIDNALDAKAQRINISLKEETDSLLLTILSDTMFTRNAISTTFASFDSFTSTKFRKLPTRGTLGNALKVICGAPYALAYKYNQNSPEILLTIRTPEGLHKILSPKNIGDTDPVLEFSEESMSPRTSPKTEIAIKLPYVTSEKLIHYPPLSYTQNYLIPGYFVFNPWVKFELTKGHESPLAEYTPLGIAKRYEVTRPSIHWYRLDDFTRWIRELAETIPRDGKVSLRDFVSKFKGFSASDSQQSVLHSLGIENDSLQSLANDNERIENLYKVMKSKSTPPEPETLGHLGKEVIYAALKQIFPNISESISYQCCRKIAEEGDHQIPYVVEAAVVRVDSPYLYQFYGMNNSPFLLSAPWLPVKADDLFGGITWEWKPKKGPTGKAESYSDFLKQFHLNEKEGAVIVIHMICPNLSVENYAKSKYNFAPLASDLVQVMYDVCSRYSKTRIEPNRAEVARMLLKKELQRRKGLLDTHGSIPQGEWTTQQAIYYKIRSAMNGNIGMKRKSFIKAILTECAEFGDRSWRERLGIKAAVRAQFFHRGTEYPVSFDSIEALSQKGSDLLLIEKEGVAEILEPYARKRGVAVLNTRGFAVEYAKRIMEDAKSQRGNVFLLTDWDLQGLFMGKNLPLFRRIGINDSIIELAGGFCTPPRKLVRTDVEEDYTPNEDDLQSRKLTDEERSEVAKTRVEIDALLAAVGPKALWKAIEATISGLVKVRDLTRSIEPKIRPPDSIAKPINRIQKAIDEMGKPVLEKKLNPLHEWRKDFTDVEKLEGRIQHDITLTLSRKRKLRHVAVLLSKAAKLLE